MLGCAMERQNLEEETEIDDESSLHGYPTFDEAEHNDKNETVYRPHYDEDAKLAPRSEQYTGHNTEARSRRKRRLLRKKSGNND